MKKKSFGSSARGRRAGGNVRPIPDSRIDFSDMPESTDEELRGARRVGRPSTGMAKQLIAIRLSPRLLSQLRKMAATQRKPYQTLIHELLEKAASRAERISLITSNAGTIPGSGGDWRFSRRGRNS